MATPPEDTELGKLSSNDRSSPRNKEHDAPDDFTQDPACPLQWSSGKKTGQVVALSFAVLTSAMGASVVSPAVFAYQRDFGVTETQAVVPLSLYVFALALGPVLGGSLSEMIGRFWVYTGFTFLGGIMTVGAATCNTFAGHCVLRFLAGFFLGPNISLASATMNDVFLPAQRGLPSCGLVATGFFGPALGPVIASFAVSAKGWRWAQWVLLIFIAASVVLLLALTHETHHGILKSRQFPRSASEQSHHAPVMKILMMTLLHSFSRPFHMLFTEPIVAFICLYVSVEFANLFMFLTSIPYSFQKVYGLSLNDTGLVFLSVIVGTLFGVITIIACDLLIYRKRVVPRYPPHKVPPEHRLYAAMLGSFGPILGLFWFGWTARRDISVWSPICAIMPYAWGYLCIFVSLMQYAIDVYAITLTSTLGSAGSFSRYAIAGAFPLFTVKLYRAVGIGWMSSLLGFVAVVLMLVPFVLFRFGKRIRSKSRYETTALD